MVSGVRGIGCSKVEILDTFVYIKENFSLYYTLIRENNAYISGDDLDVL